mmetsp:Transcript_15616/g.21148  ORF Transcript_15616/g.21148 Transcript_15616/m.21148 type:complete len:96 (-) Transcript_15616:1634-1921(-)
MGLLACADTATLSRIPIDHHCRVIQVVSDYVDFGYVRGGRVVGDQDIIIVLGLLLLLEMAADFARVHVVTADQLVDLNMLGSFLNLIVCLRKRGQ